MPPRVFVVANAPEGERIAVWLRELAADVRVGEGSDETLAALQAEPAEVVVLTSGLATGDALAFASALWDAGSTAQLVLVADETGPVRTALDAMEFRADRFLRRPLSRSALTFAVKSCLNLANFGRPDVAQAVARPRRGADGRRALSGAFAALGDIAPESTPIEVSSGVAVHTLASRIETATAEAVEAFLHEAVASVLSSAPEASFEELVELEPDLEPAEDAPPERESTLVLSRASAPPPDEPNEPLEPRESRESRTPPPHPPRPPAGEPRRARAPEAGGTGTFVSNLRRHMSALEAKLFGEPGDAAAPAHGDDDGDIDLEAIGVTTLSSLPDEGPITTDVDGTPPPPPPDVFRAPAAPLGVPSTGRTPAPAMVSNLADEDVAALLGRLARERLTGRVVLRQAADAEKTLLLEDGRPVFALSTASGDRMGDQLVREGKISPAQRLKAEEILVASGRRMGEILVELGYLKRRELLPAVRRHVEDVLYSLFAWERGSVAVSSGAGARDEKIRLATPAPALIAEGIRRKLGLERLRALVGPPSAVIAPLRRDDAAELLAEAELTTEERQVVELCDGRRTLFDVAAAGPGELTAYQVAHFLRAVALAAPLPREGTDSGRMSTGVSSPGTSTGSITGAADAAIDRERVLAKHAHVREADYFELLGVRRDATAFEIRRAFEAARRDYAPEAFSAEVQRELGGELAEIAEVLAEAQRVLRDDAVRASYLAHLSPEDRDD